MGLRFVANPIFVSTVGFFLGMARKQVEVGARSRLRRARNGGVVPVLLVRSHLGARRSRATAVRRDRGGSRLGDAYPRFLRPRGCRYPEVVLGFSRATRIVYAAAHGSENGDHGLVDCRPQHRLTRPVTIHPDQAASSAATTGGLSSCHATGHMIPRGKWHATPWRNVSSGGSNRAVGHNICVNEEVADSEPSNTARCSSTPSPDPAEPSCEKCNESGRVSSIPENPSRIEWLAYARDSLLHRLLRSDLAESCSGNFLRVLMMLSSSFFAAAFSPLRASATA